MSCRRAFEVDLVDFLAEPGGAAFADFRDHYPRCRECSAEVRAWTELQLQSGAREPGAGHPEASLLARYEDGAEGLAPGVFTVEVHPGAPAPPGGEPEGYAFRVRGPLR